MQCFKNTKRELGLFFYRACEMWWQRFKRMKVKVYSEAHSKVCISLFKHDETLSVRRKNNCRFTHEQNFLLKPKIIRKEKLNEFLSASFISFATHANIFLIQNCTFLIVFFPVCFSFWKINQIYNDLKHVYKYV